MRQVPAGQGVAGRTKKLVGYSSFAVRGPHPAAKRISYLLCSREFCKGGNFFIKKFTALFTESLVELKHVYSVTVMAMFAAISVVLGYFTLVLGDYLKIGFSTIANQFVYYLFGPVAGGMFGGALDILKYIIRPTGAYFPGFTIGAMVGGVLYGCFLYKRPISLVRVLAAELTVSVICNMLLGTLWLSMLYGKGFLALLPMRVLKNLIMWPVNSMLFYTIGKTLEASGVFRLLKTAGRKALI